ncbi:MAG: ankyrin repeat domain-containing protein [Proteobacteria bacterium]|nr:ankyrin repeat domain-containing protein [Candidatus Enterousia scatequi]
MKFIRLIAFCLFLTPMVSFAATGSDFVAAAQLLAAAKNGDIQQVQALVNNGVDVNYTDKTGLSIVCTALMNKDVRAAQILQMYGADASVCDKQIRQYKNKTVKPDSGGLFSGLSSAQSIALAAAGAAVVVGGAILLTKVFDPDNGNGGSSSGNRGEGDTPGGGGGGSTIKATFTVPNGVAPEAEYTANLDLYSAGAFKGSFDLMSSAEPYENYLLMMHGYSPFARGYMGQRTLRDTTNRPLNLSGNNLGTNPVGGGRPVNVALVTANGINVGDKDNPSSLTDSFIIWSTVNENSTAITGGSNTMISSKYYNNFITLGTDNASVDDDSTAEDKDWVNVFDLAGYETAINNKSATAYDNLLAKIVAGRTPFDEVDDYVGFLPNGQLSVFRTGGGIDANGTPIDYLNYRALLNSAGLYVAGDLNYSEQNTKNLGRSRPTIFANAAMVPSLRLTDAKTINDVLSADAGDDMLARFLTYINDTYNVVEDDYLPSADANTLFKSIGNLYGNTGVILKPMLVFSTGAYQGADSNFSGEVKQATFENAAPLVYNNLEHNFMSVVSVGLTGTGTKDASSVSGFAPAGKYALSAWTDKSGTEDTYYRSRICGTAGSGTKDIDPWCFAAAGVTDEMGVSAAAGAVGAVQSAFSYMTNDQVFSLLALTADGAYLGTNSAGTAFSKDSLVEYLKSMYELPGEYQQSVELGTRQYLDAFQEVFGYGLINLERATTPGKSVYYYDGTKIRSDKGNGYWRAASNTAFNLSAPFGARGATISAPFYDVVTSVDGELSMPRIWENEFTIGADSAHALYMGDVLGDLKTRGDEKTQIGEKTTLSLARSMRAYNDNMGGLDNLGIEYSGEHFNMNADYQRYLTDGVSRFNGMANPILGLASNAITTGGEYKYGNFAFGGRAFSGVISDESLLQNDPMISSRYEPMRLGFARGGQANVAWQNNKFMLSGAFGVLNETNTLLGAQTSGLLDMGNGNTTYVDVTARYDATDDVAFTLRSTFARTYANPSGNFVLGISELDSNAFAFGADVGNFNLTVSQPLTISSGSLQYAYAQYDVVESGARHYDLVVSDTGIRDLSLVPEKREVRFTGTYRHQFGEFTDGALGFIYRINPNNTDAFGNESIFMLKMTHRLGI